MGCCSKPVSLMTVACIWDEKVDFLWTGKLRMLCMSCVRCCRSTSCSIKICSSLGSAKGLSSTCLEVHCNGGKNNKWKVLAMSTIGLHLLLAVPTGLPTGNKHDKHKSGVLQGAERTHLSEWANGVATAVPIVLFASLDIVACGAVRGGVPL